MVNIISYVLIIIIIILGIKESFLKARRDRTLLETVNKILYYFSIFITLILLISNLELVFKYIYNVIYKMDYIGESFLGVSKIILLMVTFLVCQLSIYGLLRLVSCPFQVRGGMVKEYILYPISVILGSVKSIILVLIIFIVIITYNATIANNNKIKAFENLKSYNKLEAMIIKTKEYVYEDEDYENTYSKNIIIFYNGVTLDEGVKSCDGIDNKATEITKDLQSDREKANSIYSWIGNNIDYDYDKAEKALNNEKLKGSGAIEAWKQRSGICFDFACLFVAMARDCDLKVRLITGSAFDGIDYGPHAWNEVFLSDEDKWITVDSTFYSSGNYFDSINFYDDHIKENVAGQW